MKLIVQKDKIIDGLQKAAGIIPSKAGAAYLRSIWLKAENSSLSIMATDANIEFTGTYEANVEEPGMAGVQGRAFVDLIRQLPSGELQISEDKNGANLLLRQGKRSYKLSMSSKEWFQEFSAYPEGESVAWTGGVFSDYLDRVSFCIGDDDVQDALNCLCLKPGEEGRIDICGLNGHQFAIVSFIYDDLAAMLPEKGLLIQKRYLSDIKKWLGEDEIELNLTEKRFYLRRGDKAEMLSLPRAIYEYPDYNLFMSKLSDPDVSKLQITRKEVMDSLGRLQVFNSEADRCVYLELKPEETHFSAQGGDLGSARESLDAIYSGSLDRIAFPTRNLLEIYGHFTSQTLNQKFTGAEGPSGITGSDDMGYTVIIMPMKVANLNYYEEDEAPDPEKGQNEE